ncbi:Inherit from virNOG: Magnesium-dependent phosphatase [Seminavis robusta]|uniref:Inherit from virNOG: Magnesium-dependent phosphatase n=1 Tax=Seminavis robusta TaxID=568900 RepID=A0A9N8DB56_9STRA|nr:Inherit from virNOG: Magnesium-dependent phosphatase [Seminavis robusta]|eukprot:Sro5_g004770.1 Inherit from virNOG: Magnesium-dependent phosphatase (500) ;mRNA; r:250025-251524
MASAANDNNNDKKITKFPKLIVLDLDNTVWTPELYQLRKLQRANNQTPIAHKHVQLFPGARDLISKIRSQTYFPPTTQFAVASRTKSVDWAHDLLDQFELRALLDYVEIFPGHKRQHFEHLRRDSKLEYADMLFFDDSRDGKYGNCEPVSAMGVLSVHCPTGLETSAVWETALQQYQNWNGQPNTIVEWDGSVTTSANSNSAAGGDIHEGTIKTVNYDKRFGFIQYKNNNKAAGGGRGNNNNDMFFHFSNLPAGVTTVEKGDKLRFTIQKDPRNGKFRAANIEMVDNDSNNSNDETISMRAFSMNMPFAALLANGHKTLESRNGTMFKPYPAGTQMLLHVGRRTYPDGNRHLEIMNDQGLDNGEITKRKSLPTTGGFGKGMVVAILEIGKTYETTLQQRSESAMQQQICAYGADSGRIVTEIVKVKYLKKPVPMAAQGGVFKVNIPRDVVPDDWELPPGVVSPDAYKVAAAPQASSPKNTGSSGKKEPKSQQPMYSISG